MPSLLSDRLNQLRRDATGETASEASGASKLAERIARLRQRPDRGEALRRQVGGEWLADGVLHLTLDAPAAPWDRPACEALEPSVADASTLRFIDTETTGLAGGTGTTVFLFGSGRLVGDRLELSQWLLTRPGAEPAFWEAVDAALGETFTLVSYNGKSFDWPLVTTRRRLVRSRRLEPVSHIDLVHPVRRAFGSRWPDCRLTTCEERLLRSPRRNDLGGEFAPWAYREFLAGRSIDPLSRIIEHHQKDIVSLASLLPLVGRAQLEPAAHAADADSVARYWLGLGRADIALTALDGARTPEACWLRAEAYRRLENWDRAVALWESLADSGDPRALEALAKYHEHRARDLRQALGFGRRLVERVPDDPRHRHRLARLERRAGVAATGV